jgi:hypothetical protein
MRDNLLVKLKSRNKKDVIGCFNIYTRKWNILDFFSGLEICGITGFKEGNLIVHANSKYFNEHYFYKIPFG